MGKLEERIGKLLEEILEDSSEYLAEVQVRGSEQYPKVVVILDGDEGVTIDRCAEVSRKLGSEIETLNLIDSRYNLEVSSPGVDQPITTRKQYVKNIGRRISVELNEGKTLSGRLLAIENDELTIAVETLAKNGKNKKIEEQKLPFDEIKVANVLISFK